MRESNEEIERRLHTALNRAKRQPARSARVGHQSAVSSKATRHAHVKMLGAVATSRIQDVRDEIDDVLEKGLEPDSETWLRISAAQERALMGALEAAQAVADSLRLERDQARAKANALRDERDDRSGKERQRAEASAIVAAGDVSVYSVARNTSGVHVLASVQSDGRAYEICKSPSEHWSCECRARGECKHVRSVQLCFPCDVMSTAGRNGAALAAAGGVTIKMQAPQSALAEVVDGAQTHVVARTGFGGWDCSCGALNARCVHGDATRHVTRRL